MRADSAEWASQILPYSVRITVWEPGSGLIRVKALATTRHSSHRHSFFDCTISPTDPSTFSLNQLIEASRTCLCKIWKKGCLDDHVDYIVTSLAVAATA